MNLVYPPPPPKKIYFFNDCIQFSWVLQSFQEKFNVTPIQQYNGYAFFFGGGGII